MSQMIPEKIYGFAGEAGFWKSGDADEGRKPAGDTHMGGLRRKIRALQFGEGPREGQEHPARSPGFGCDPGPRQSLSLSGDSGQGSSKSPKTARTTISTNSLKNIWEIQFTLSGNQAKCASLTRIEPQKSQFHGLAHRRADSDSYIKFCILRLTTDKPTTFNSQAARRRGAAMRPSAVPEHEYKAVCGEAPRRWGTSKLIGPLEALGQFPLLEPKRRERSARRTR